jgi:hypothetical protein
MHQQDKMMIGWDSGVLLLQQLNFYSPNAACQRQFLNAY